MSCVSNNNITQLNISSLLVLSQCVLVWVPVNGSEPYMHTSRLGALSKLIHLSEVSRTLQWLPSLYSQHTCSFHCYSSCSPLLFSHVLSFISLFISPTRLWSQGRAVRDHFVIVILALRPTRSPSTRWVLGEVTEWRRNRRILDPSCCIWGRGNPEWPLHDLSLVPFVQKMSVGTTDTGSCLFPGSSTSTGAAGMKTPKQNQHPNPNLT